MNNHRIKYVVDVDIEAFFDNVNHEWLMKFLKHRISDTNMQRLIFRLLKAGIIEAGIKYDTPQGTPQGGVISPILGNLYLHYIIDVWFEKGIKKRSRGIAEMVRYADDSVFCFEYKDEAYAFYHMLEKRLEKFGLKLSKAKSKIVKIKEDDNDNDSDTNKEVESFDFLGFTHYWGMARSGMSRICRKTNKKRYSAGLQRCKVWMKLNRTLPTKDFMKKINSKVQGHINYYGVTDNYNSVNDFVDEVRSLIYKWLNRRSQRKSFNWSKFILFMRKYPLPKPKTYVNLFKVKDKTCYNL